MSDRDIKPATTPPRATRPRVFTPSPPPMPPKVIQIQPDAPALLAHRLVRRLLMSGLVDGRGHTKQSYQLHIDALTEALADEIHLAALDGTLSGRPAR